MMKRVCLCDVIVDTSRERERGGVIGGLST
jgi:hypothetical protein